MKGKKIFRWRWAKQSMFLWWKYDHYPIANQPRSTKLLISIYFTICINWYTIWDWKTFPNFVKLLVTMLCWLYRQENDLHRLQIVENTSCRGSPSPWSVTLYNIPPVQKILFTNLKISPPKIKTEDLLVLIAMNSGYLLGKTETKPQ